MSNTSDIIRSQITAAKERVRKLEILESLIQDPDLEDALREITLGSQGRVSLPSNGSKATKTKKSRKKASGHFERVKEFFESSGNEWTPAPEIVKALAISRGVISNLLYVGYPDAFESKDHPDKARLKLWKLKSVS